MNALIQALAVCVPPCIALAAPATSRPKAITSVEALPSAARAAYLERCPADAWSGGRRRLRGSALQALPGGGTAYLMVCGDAASLIPFAVLVADAAGRISVDPVDWTRRGERLRSTVLGNASFGTRPGTLISNTHLSAACEPVSAHRWDGTAFRLARVDGRGCKAEDL